VARTRLDTSRGFETIHNQRSKREFDLACITVMNSKVLILALSASYALGIASADTSSDLIQSLDTVKSSIDNNILLYQTPDFQWEPSTIYRYDDLLESIRIMAAEGVAGKTFYIGEDVENGHVYGLVNLAAFLAQSMKETIQYDACDENSVRKKVRK
jgi:hypothetical protein